MLNVVVKILLFSALLLGTATASQAASLTVSLNEAERAFVAGHPSINYCIDPDFMPLEGNDSGRHIGMSAQYVAIFEQLTGIKFNYQPTQNWNDSLQALRNADCDLIPLIMPTPARQDYVLFSDSYVEVPLVIATGMDKPFIVDFDEVATEKLGIVKGYAFVEILRQKYPDSNIVEVDSSTDGLYRVEAGELYGYVGALSVISYSVQQNNIQDIKISGEFDYRWQLNVGVRKQYPQLVSIINKAIKEIDPAQHRAISRSWINVNYQKKQDYTLVLQVAAAFILLISGLIYRNHLLRQHNLDLERLSQTDKLTGLFNRVKTDESIQQHIARFERYHDDFSIILLDIDGFKALNDNYGHLMGDNVLVQIATILKTYTRKTDLVGRWGGEEFLVLCPNTNGEDANTLAEHLRAKLEGFYIEKIGRVTASFGVASNSTYDNHTTLLKRADDALLKAKRDGKNCVVYFTNS